jgi:Ribbon-helix-helix protein, copG family
LTECASIYTVFNMVKQTPGILGVRLDKADRDLIRALKLKLGVKSVSDLVRQALRALATKEGVSA